MPLFISNFQSVVVVKRPDPGSYLGLLPRSKKCGCLWLVVALVGVDGNGNILSNCLEYLVVAPVIVPVSEGFQAAAEDVPGSQCLTKRTGGSLTFTSEVAVCRTW